MLRAIASLHGRHREIRHLHVGHGPSGKYLEIAKAEGLPEDVVRMPGAVEDIEKFYAALDLSCMPSRTEALGTVALEAMACGLPTVASRVGGIPEAVEDGVTGHLVPPEDPAALADAIERLLDDPEQRAQLGGAGGERVVERFGLEVMLDKTEKLYLALAAERGQRRTGDGAPTEPRL